MRLQETLTLILAFACALTWPLRAGGADEPLRVKAMTFNIRFGTAPDGPNEWTRRRTMVMDVIRDSACDFVGVQESMPFQTEQLTHALPQYLHISRTREADPRKGEATPIFYHHDRWRLDDQENGTFWLSSRPDEPGSKGWSAALPRITTWARFVEKNTGRGVYVFNTHLDHISGDARLNGAKLIAQRIAGRARPDEPVILTGDLNAGESDDPVRYLIGAGSDSPARLIDTFRAIHPEAKDVGTMTVNDKGEWVGRRDGPKIDYIFAAPVMQVVTASIDYYNVDGRYPSDHYPVTTELLLQPGAKP